MSKECKLCYTVNDDNAEICLNCGVAFQDEKSEDNSDNNKNVKYIITCPICGKEYEVPTIDSIIESCDDEEDDFDRHQIKKQRARAIYLDDNNNSCESIKQLSDDNCGDVYIKEQELVLTDVRNDNRINIGECGGVIGRNGDYGSDLFAANLYISSLHFKITFEENTWYIEHLSNTNSTIVNGTKLIHNMKFKLREGDRVVVPECALKVSIKEK